MTEFGAVGDRPSLGTHRRLGHVPPLSDVLAVLLVRHADPLFGHHRHSSLLMTASLLGFRFDSGIFFPVAAAGSSAAADGGTERTPSLVYVLKKLMPRPAQPPQLCVVSRQVSGRPSTASGYIFQIKSRLLQKPPPSILVLQLVPTATTPFLFFVAFVNLDSFAIVLAIYCYICFCLCNVQCTLGSHCVCGGKSFSFFVLHIQTQQT